MRSDEEAFFFSESIRQARRLPLSECLDYLRGMLSVMREDHEAAAEIRSVIAQLTGSDAQLELIQIGQIQRRLGLDQDTHRPDRHRRPGKKGTQ
jgi:hypothetical protein